MKRRYLDRGRFKGDRVKCFINKRGPFFNDIFIDNKKWSILDLISFSLIFRVFLKVNSNIRQIIDILPILIDLKWSCYIIILLKRSEIIRVIYFVLFLFRNYYSITCILRIRVCWNQISLLGWRINKWSKQLRLRWN
jgi:hypothetical protein